MIGSHPHVLQKMVHYKNKGGLVIYSLGNFISNQRKETMNGVRTSGGAMVHIQLRKSDQKTFIHHAGYSLTWVYKKQLQGKNKFYILPCRKYENQPGFFENKDHFLSIDLLRKSVIRIYV